MTRILYDVEAAAQATSTSASTIRRAIHTTDPHSYPPPLRAKRRGTGQSAAILIEHDELVRWSRALPDA